MPIKIEELCRYFRVGGSTVRALDGVSLNIDDGEYVTSAEPAAAANLH